MTSENLPIKRITKYLTQFLKQTFRNNHTSHVTAESSQNGQRPKINAVSIQRLQLKYHNLLEMTTELRMTTTVLETLVEVLAAETAVKLDKFLLIKTKT